MEIVDIILLALIQGLTEFLPISSSAHLILPSAILGWKDQGMAFDVAVHVGSLLAVSLYFRKEVGSMLVAWVNSIAKKEHSDDSQLAWWIFFASIPAGLFGYLGNDFIEENLRSAAVICITTIVFGLALGVVDYKAPQNRSIQLLGFKRAMVIGFAQVLAMIPGTSRSGITMTFGLILGLTREGAARFSFLLSIPVIVMAGGYRSYKLLETNEVVNWLDIGLGAGLSFISAYACIHYFLILVEKLGMMPFVIYRLILGAGLAWYVWG